MDIFNVHGTAAHMPEVVAAIEAAAPNMAGKITFEPKDLALPGEVDGAPLANVIGPLPRTPLAQGVAETMTRFRELTAAGALTAADMLKK